MAISDFNFGVDPNMFGGANTTPTTTPPSNSPLSFGGLLNENANVSGFNAGPGVGGEDAGGGMFGNMGMDEISAGMKGLSGLGNFGLGVANYIQNKNNFEKMMKFQNANFAQQKQASALNASLEQERQQRLGIKHNATTTGLFDKTTNLG